jgi:hypothetical protein
LGLEAVRASTGYAKISQALKRDGGHADLERAK